MNFWLAATICLISAAILPYVGSRYMLAPGETTNTRRLPVWRLYAFFFLCLVPILLSYDEAPLVIVPATTPFRAGVVALATTIVLLVSLFTGVAHARKDGLRRHLQSTFGHGRSQPPRSLSQGNEAHF